MSRLGMEIHFKISHKLFKDSERSIVLHSFESDYSIYKKPRKMLKMFLHKHQLATYTTIYLPITLDIQIRTTAHYYIYFYIIY